MEKNNGRRVILFPLPLQGCINPMIQLAKILHSRGFSITVIHTRFNAPKATSHPLFSFLEIQDGFSETETRTDDNTWLFTLLNRRCETPFRDCLTNLLGSSSDSETERISCLIHDSGWTFFTRSVAKSLKLPRLVLNTYTVSFFLNHFALPKLRREVSLLSQDSEAEDSVPTFQPLRKKDLARIMGNKDQVEPLDAYLVKILETTKPASGLIVMSCEELDRDSLSESHKVFAFPIYPIGPPHIHDVPASSSSLFEPDQSCTPWLDKQETRSVMYVSLGSIVTITDETELLEIAWGLRNSDQPFLWVVRVGMVNGTKWIEAIPEELMERLKEKGKIVKWAPQQDVLKHRATGGFLTHNGWNSTVESVCEGVPMICVPSVWDQLLNARFVSDVWMVGLHLEGRIERNEIERVVRKLLLEPEGEVIRERMQLLAEKVGRSVKQNGSAYRSLEHLVDHISSF
ncbi:unnamed protein product [Brassica oleracea]